MYAAESNLRTSGCNAPAALQDCKNAAGLMISEQVHNNLFAEQQPLIAGRE
jgi:hypothetical protein